MPDFHSPHVMSFLWCLNTHSCDFFSFKGCSQIWNKIEPRIATLEFDRDRKSMGVIVNSGSGKKSLLVKVISPVMLIKSIV